MIKGYEVEERILIHVFKIEYLFLVEFGVTGAIGTNYATTGFSAAYTLAHEIGSKIFFSI